MDETEQQADQSPGRYVAIIGDIVSAYVSNNSVPPSELSTLIASVNAAVIGLTAPVKIAEPEYTAPVTVKQSTQRDYLISMIDGKRYRTLRRHIGKHDLTVDEYKARYNLPHDYPLVCASYSEQRSEMAKRMGLGAKSTGRTPGAKKLAPKKPAGKRGRPRKDAA